MNYHSKNLEDWHYIEYSNKKNKTSRFFREVPLEIWNILFLNIKDVAAR